jgi:Trm5-related predicted tRNA methylase
MADPRAIAGNDQEAALVSVQSFQPMMHRLQWCLQRAMIQDCSVVCFVVYREIKP